MIVRVLGKRWKVQAVQPGEEVPQWATHGWWPKENFASEPMAEDCDWQEDGPWPLLPGFRRAKEEGTYTLIAAREQFDSDQEEGESPSERLLRHLKEIK